MKKIAGAVLAVAILAVAIPVGATTYEERRSFYADELARINAIQQRREACLQEAGATWIAVYLSLPGNEDEKKEFEERANRVSDFVDTLPMTRFDLWSLAVDEDRFDRMMVGMRQYEEDQLYLMNLYCNLR